MSCEYVKVDCVSDLTSTIDQRDARSCHYKRLILNSVMLGVGEVVQTAPTPGTSAESGVYYIMPGSEGDALCQKALSGHGPPISGRTLD